MEQNDKTNSFKKLLDRLQEDSWQLELLISGFAIFGLFYALDPITHKLSVAHFDNNEIFVKFFIIVHFALKVLIFNLLLHVLLRGMWIGSLGMRYVFGEIDFEKLNYGEQFTKYLKKNVGSFDTYINKLENICSVIFALTFLLVFYIFAFFIVGFLLLSFNNPVPSGMVVIVQVMFLVFSIGVLLTFIDFISLGLLKKNKWTAKIYFPFYWLFSFLTLSFLYRPLIYNLLDNKHGRRLSLILIPFYILIYVVFHLEYQKSNFITREATKQSSTSIANGSNYEDEIEKNESIFKGEFVIQSKVVSEPYLKVFVPLSSHMEDSLFAFNPSLKPEKDARGLHFESFISINQKEPDYEKHNKAYLSAFEGYYRFSIDSQLYETDFVISNNTGTLGFETYIGIKDLSEGKHIIDFQCRKLKDGQELVSLRKVPFWYFKD